jgi:hypothetical protein
MSAPICGTSTACAAYREAAEHVDRRERDAGDREPADDLGPRPSPGGATCTSAPMMMMLLMALVTLMSGVCSAGVTFHTTM